MHHDHFSDSLLHHGVAHAAMVHQLGPPRLVDPRGVYTQLTVPPSLCHIAPVYSIVAKARRHVGLAGVMQGRLYSNPPD